MLLESLFLFWVHQSKFCVLLILIIGIRHLFLDHLALAIAPNLTVTSEIDKITVQKGKDASFTCTVKNLGGYRVS